ncbi:MAG TPA: succinate dehydrogenase cytochrome b subunit [Thermoanaerobaculia bacterium]|nr:succinate dehydrogenase cytochrome b subunit [Thermoanaerobaculia bacterium]
MTWFGSFYRSAVGKKATMAVTGIVFWGFVVGHMAGNLKLFAGGEAFNEYAHFLREIGYPLVPHSGLLWVARVVLLVSLALHVHAAVTLTLLNRRARPEGYAEREPQQIGIAERTMRWTGFALLAFIVYHILHFTTGQAHGNFIPGDPFANLTYAFENVAVVAIYVVAMLFLSLHLYHGLWSLFQSLGWNHPRFNGWRRVFAVAFALIVSLGFALVPLAVFTGLAGG